MIEKNSVHKDNRWDNSKRYELLTESLQRILDLFSPEKLKLLLIMTVADILAVGPGKWNSWKASLMRDLYRFSEKVLYGADPHQILELNPDKSKDKIKKTLHNWTEEDFDNYSDQYPSNQNQVS